MHVAILNYRFYPIIDGPSIQARLLGEKLTDNGVRVLVLTRRFSDKHLGFEKVNGINVRRLSSFGGYLLGHFPYALHCFLTLYRYKKEIDVINTHGSIGMAMIGVVCGKVLRKRIISTFNTSGLKITGRVSSTKIPVLGWLMSVLLKNVDATVAISNQIYEDLRSVRLPESKMHIIPSGVDVHLFSPVSQEQKRILRNRLRLPKKTLVLFTGRLVYTKGVDILLEALRDIIKRTTDIHVLIIGKGGFPKAFSAEEELKRFVKDHNLGQYVTFAGYVDKLYEYLQASDIFAFPSRWEGLGCSMLEAMSCGIPVVATNIGGIPDAIQDGVDGLLFPVNDHKELAKKILILKNDVNLAERLAKNARQKVEEMFSIEVVAQRYAELYRANGF